MQIPSKGTLVAEFGPDTMVGQAAVAGDLVGGQPLGVGLATISVWLSAVTAMPLGKASPSATCRAVPALGGQHDNARRVRLAGHHVEASAVHVGVAAAVDDELVAGRRIRALTEIGIHLERAVGLLHEQPTRARIDDKQPSVRQPVDTERKRRAAVHDLGGAVSIDSDDLLCSPIGEPEAPVVPTRLAPRKRCLS